MVIDAGSMCVRACVCLSAFDLICLVFSFTGHSLLTEMNKRVGAPLAQPLPLSQPSVIRLKRVTSIAFLTSPFIFTATLVVLN